MAVPEGIQKIIIPYNNLPYSTSDGSYHVRYRVITESKDIFSSWSPRYKVPAVPVSQIVGVDYDPNAVIVSDGDTVSLNWTVPENILLDTFDVYVKWSAQNDTPTEPEWDALPWSYITTTQANSASLAIPAASKVSQITAVSYTSTVATYTTATTHNLQVGEWVTIAGLAPYGYNGTFQVVDINVAAKTFKVANTTNTVLTDSTGNVSIQARYVRFWVQVPTQTKVPGDTAKLFESAGDFVNLIPGLDGGTPFIA